MNHCFGCHGHVYDEQREECAEHTLDGDEDRTDCPGCQECEQLTREKSELARQCLITVKSWKDRMTAEVGLKEAECERLHHQLEQAAKAAGIEKTECECTKAIGIRMCTALGISTDQDEDGLVKACENLRRLLVEHCEEDTEIRNVLRPILGPLRTDGDSYGVPSVLDLVGAMRARLTKAERVVRAVKNADWKDYLEALSAWEEANG